MGTRLLVELLDEFDPAEFFAVDSNWDSLLKRDLDQFGVLVRGVVGPLVDVVGRDCTRVFEFGAFDGAAPEVRVDGVAAAVATFDGQALLGGVLVFPFAGQSEFTDRCDDIEVGVAPDGLEAQLVVALASTAVGDGRAALLFGD